MEKTEELDCCAFCLMSKKDEVVLLCKHSFCYDCMESYCEIVRFNRRCPVCRQNFSYFEKKFGNPLVVIADEEEDEMDDEYDSDSEFSDYSVHTGENDEEINEGPAT